VDVLASEPPSSLRCCRECLTLSEAVANGRPALGLKAKDFKTDQEVRCCPGCGDYAILAEVQSFMPELNIEREKTVFVSGIGCSSRFPY
jgi:2-oxoglutarate ferredoxin oxidoreductase subunit beta